MTLIPRLRVKTKTLNHLSNKIDEFMFNPIMGVTRVKGFITKNFYSCLVLGITLKHSFINRKRGVFEYFWS